MFCIKCGQQLPDDSGFCSKCGADLRNLGATVSQPADENKTEGLNFSVNTDSVEQQTDFESKAPEKKKKKKRTGLVLAIVLPIVLVIAVLACLFCAFWLWQESIPTSAVYAYVDDVGNAYVAYDNGKLIKIGGDVSEACMTEDLTKIVVVEKKGQVYWTDAELTEKHKIKDTSDDISAEIATITNKFAIIALTDEGTQKPRYSVVRCEFEGDNSLKVFSGNQDEAFALEMEVSYAYGVDEVSFAMAKDGKISVLAPDSDEFTDIASYDKRNSVDVIGVSNDGKTVAWSVAGDGKYSVMLDLNGRTETVKRGDVSFSEITKNNYMEYLEEFIADTYVDGKFESMEDYYADLMANWTAEILEQQVEDGEAFIVKKLTDYFSKNAGAPSFTMDVSPDGSVVVISGDGMTAFVKDGEVSSVTLPSEVCGLIYSTNGLPLCEDAKAKKAYGYYVCVEDTSGTYDGDTVFSLYYVGFDAAEREKLLSSIKYVTFAQDKVIYTNKDDVLECAVFDADKKTLGESRRIGTDVAFIEVSTYNSNYIYYAKNYSLEDGTFGLNVYDFKNDRSESVSSDVSGDFSVSYDGKQVYYYTNRSEDSKTGVFYSTLNIYDVKTEKRVTVAADVVEGTLTSNVLTGEIDTKSMWFEKYQTSRGETYIFNLCHYDGKKIFVAVKDLSA